MNIIEESSDGWGRWFIRYAENGAEIFSTRLLHGTGDLGIAWTHEVRQLADNIAEIQNAVGHNIPKVSGTASEGIEAIIRAGRFNPELYAKHLARRLGGQWEMEVVRRPEVINEVWDIIAKRIGHES